MCCNFLFYKTTITRQTLRVNNCDYSVEELRQEAYKVGDHSATLFLKQKGRQGWQYMMYEDTTKSLRHGEEEMEG